MSGTWRTTPDEVTIALLHNNGGLGDWITTIPAITALLAEHPHVAVKLYTRDMFIPLAKSLVNNPRVTYKSFERAVKRKEKISNAVVCQSQPINTMRIDLVSFGYLTFLYRLPKSSQEMLYPALPLHREAVASAADKFPLPEEFIVLTPGYTSEVREWKAEHLLGVKDWAISQGLGVVYLGDNKRPPPGVVGKFDDALRPGAIEPEPGVIDLRNRTSLIQAASVMARAKCVAGVDNGLLHLAATTNVPIVGGFTSVLPETRTPTRLNEAGEPEHGWRYSVVDSKKLGCGGCQTWMYGINHDFKKCLYQDKMCLDLMTAARFIKEIKKWL